MNQDTFKKRMAELAAMVGSDQCMELFNIAYEDLLNDIKAQPEPRYEMLTKMKAMTMVQGAFLLNCLRGKVSDDPHPTTMMQ